MPKTPSKILLSMSNCILRISPKTIQPSFPLVETDFHFLNFETAAGVSESFDAEGFCELFLVCEIEDLAVIRTNNDGL